MTMGLWGDGLRQVGPAPAAAGQVGREPGVDGAPALGGPPWEV